MISTGSVLASGVVLAGIVASAAEAHQETPLSVSESGQIVGLPTRYEPATFQYVLKGSSSFEASLQLSGITVLLPPCITDLLVAYDDMSGEFGASWYHEASGMPPYLLMKAFAKVEEGYAPGHSLLFDLDTAQIFEIIRFEPIQDGTHLEWVSMDSICSASEQRQLLLEVED